MNKKSFEIQFNWVFVLVVGAAILLFFTAVLVKQKDVSETTTKNTILKSIEAIIEGSSVSTDTTNIVNMPNSNIEVSCGRVSLGKASKQYQNLILFAPSSVKGSKLITQTRGFNIPYKSANLLFMTSQQARYILTGNSDFAKEINKSLPKDLGKEFHESIPTTTNQNNYKVKFILFDNLNVNSIDISHFDKMPDLDVTAIKINGDDEKGTIEFFQKDDGLWVSKGNSAYIGEAALLGAIYSDTKELFECNMQNAYNRLELVTDVLKDRTIKLRDDTTIRQECIQIYNNALAQINRIEAATSSFDTTSVNNIASASKDLSLQNKEAQKFSCPLIY
ncbi:hypothetical protein CMO83_02055 [Candidatus Woesearchaeota archaeon]|jgi:hypothetical protein|nr:hypothetical protein [Candidatus Woesearchaeota archaeon]|tara:strand:+ start:19 stop:1020 length:1002 start_codon:yes stop_codon:yes gene_type:complete